MTPTPLSLDEIEKTGATRFGRAVSRIVIVMRDGGKVSLSFADPEDDEPEEIAMTPTQQRIVQVLRSSPKPMKRLSVAKAIGRDGIGGKFSNYVNDLVSRGVIQEYAGELADVAEKFKEP